MIVSRTTRPDPIQHGPTQIVRPSHAMDGEAMAPHSPPTNPASHSPLPSQTAHSFPHYPSIKRRLAPDAITTLPLRAALTTLTTVPPARADGESKSTAGDGEEKSTTGDGENKSTAGDGENKSTAGDGHAQVEQDKSEWADGHKRAPSEEEEQEQREDYSDYDAYGIMEQHYASYKIVWKPDVKTGEEYEPSWIRGKRNIAQGLLLEWEDWRRVHPSKRARSAGEVPGCTAHGTTKG